MKRGRSCVTAASLNRLSFCVRVVLTERMFYEQERVQLFLNASRSMNPAPLERPVLQASGEGALTAHSPSICHCEPVLAALDAFHRWRYTSRSSAMRITATITKMIASHGKVMACSPPAALLLLCPAEPIKSNGSCQPIAKRS